jgi:hypothetical protein
VRPDTPLTLLTSPLAKMKTLAEKRPTWIVLGPLCLCGLSLLVACDTALDPRHTNFRVQRDNVAAQYDDKTGRLKRLEVDTNKDGKFDTVTYADGTRVERIEIDRDFNGVVDRWEYYADNALVRVGTSSRADGIADEWAFSDAHGVLQRVEADTDRDGHVDKWERFAPPATTGGMPVLTTVEFETDKGGTPSERLTYRADGSLDRVEKLR